MKRFFKNVSFAMLLATAGAAASLIDGYMTTALACNYYASPSGGGNGLSQSSPFRIANFWNVAAPGKTLCLVDGVYSDSIYPPQNLNGTASARITIRALNDGKVRINGGGGRIPVQLKYNDYFVLEGFDAYNGSATVVQVGTGADYNIVRRVCAWDGADSTNSDVWLVNSNTGNLLEDVCGFGTGRKIFSNSQQGNNVTIRRAWGRWERSTRIGGKVTFSVGYNSVNSTYENVLGTWDEMLMGSTPIDQPVGILRFGPTSPGGVVCQNNKFLGSIGYIRAEDKVERLEAVVSTSNENNCLSLRDVVAYIEPGTHTNLRPFALLNDAIGTDKLALSTTEIGGTTKSSTGSQWQISNYVVAGTINAAPNIWSGSGYQGARVCKRYVGGKLTNEPLWPWPMNQRIIDALKAAGKTPVDVTKTMEAIFGSIPSECRGSASTSSSGATIKPTAPVNLNVTTGG